MRNPAATSPPQPFDVVVAGCIGVDTNVFLYGRDVDWSVETNFSENFDYVGQAGGCSARGFRRLGLRTALIGSVGEDPMGSLVRQELERDGIPALLYRNPLGTHRSINLMAPDGRRKNFYDGKGQGKVTPNWDECRAWLRGARVLHVHLEDWCRHLLPMARELGITVSCDLQDLVALDDPYRQDFMEHADVLFLSTTNFPEPEPIIERLLSGRPERIVIGGMGKNGAIIGMRDGIQRFGPVAFPEPVVDTNGAGDSLAVGFLTSYYFDRLPPAQALLRGQIAARIACTKKASSSQFVTRDELAALAEKQPPWR